MASRVLIDPVHVIQVFQKDIAELQDVVGGTWCIHDLVQLVGPDDQDIARVQGVERAVDAEAVPVPAIADDLPVGVPVGGKAVMQAGIRDHDGGVIGRLQIFKICQIHTVYLLGRSEPGRKAVIKGNLKRPPAPSA